MKKKKNDLKKWNWNCHEFHKENNTEFWLFVKSPRQTIWFVSYAHKMWHSFESNFRRRQTLLSLLPTEKLYRKQSASTNEQKKNNPLRISSQVMTKRNSIIMKIILTICVCVCVCVGVNQHLKLLYYEIGEITS